MFLIEFYINLTIFFVIKWVKINLWVWELMQTFDVVKLICSELRNINLDQQMHSGEN